MINTKVVIPHHTPGISANILGKHLLYYINEGSETGLFVKDLTDKILRGLEGLAGPGGPNVVGTFCYVPPNVTNSMKEIEMDKHTQKKQQNKKKYV